MLFDGKQVKIQFCHCIYRNIFPKLTWNLYHNYVYNCCCCLDAALFMTAAKMSLREISPAGFLFRIGPMPQGQIMWWYRFPFASICSIASRDGNIKCLSMSLPQLNGEQHKAIHSITVACSKDRCFRWGRSWSWNAFLLALSWCKGTSVVKSGVRYESFSNPGQDSIS